MIVNRPNKLF